MVTALLPVPLTLPVYSTAYFDPPGSPLAHLTTLTSCLSPSSLRLVRRAAAESGWAWSCPAFTTSGSMDSRMLRKTSCEWNVRPDLGDGFWINSTEPDGKDETGPSSSGTFSWPIFFSLRAETETETRSKYCPNDQWSRAFIRCLDPYHIHVIAQLASQIVSIIHPILKKIKKNCNTANTENTIYWVTPVLITHDPFFIFAMINITN